MTVPQVPGMAGGPVSVAGLLQELDRENTTSLMREKYKEWIQAIESKGTM